MFNENHYNKLLDGLECVELKFSQIYNDDNFTKRIDAEYQRKKFLNNISYLNSINSIELCKGYDGSVNGGKRLPKGEDFSESGIKYARAEDNKGNFLNIEDSPYISLGLHNVLWRYTTTTNDVLITIVGNGIGDVSINKYPKDLIINLTENCAKINNVKSLSPELLFIYLKSKYGNLQIFREKVGTAQPKLSIERIRKIIIPKFDSKYDEKIQNIVNASYEKEKISKELYHEAENLLKSFINIDVKEILDNNQKGINIKSLSNSFNNTKRIDAEYYQKKYEILVERLKKINSVKLGELVTIKKSIEPGSENYVEDGIPFVRVSDITKYGVDSVNINVPFDIVPNPEKLYPKKDEILFSKDGTIGIAYKVMSDCNFITSSALLHLKIKNERITSDYLTLVLNSEYIRMQAERDTNGSILQHWKKDEIENVLIPIISLEKQEIINNQIKKSFIELEESKSLIRRAIKSVELYISNNADEAYKLLD